MKRQLLAGRFGPDDSFDVTASADEQRTYLQLVAGEKSLNHGIGGALTNLKKIGVFPSEIGIDLLVLAAHIHAADTRISRTEQSQDSWTREIRLVVPVSDPARWDTVAPTLKKSLDFLTGDRWTIGFRARPGRFTTLSQAAPPSLIAPPFDSVSLFSGGLDSLIGAIDLLEDGATPLLVSHFGDGATSNAQGKLFAGLKKHYIKSPFERLRVGMTFVDGLVEGVGGENSTRGRSFLFFALGVFAGTGLGRRFVLRVPAECAFGPPSVGIEQHPHHASVLHGEMERSARRARHRRRDSEPILGHDEGRDGRSLPQPGPIEEAGDRFIVVLVPRQGQMAWTRHPAMWLLPALSDPSRSLDGSMGGRERPDDVYGTQSSCAAVGHTPGDGSAGQVVSVRDRALEGQAPAREPLDSQARLACG